MTTADYFTPNGIKAYEGILDVPLSGIPSNLIPGDKYPTYLWLFFNFRLALEEIKRLRADEAIPLDNSPALR